MTRSLSMFLRASVVSLPLLATACSSGDGTQPPPVPDPVAELPAPTPTPVPKQAALPPPISGGTLAVLSDGNTAVASDPDRDQIYVVDLASKTVRHTLALQPGDEPGRHVQDASGMVHVALRRGGALLSFDPQSGEILSRRELCGAPRGITFDAQRNLLHVACADGQLVSISPNAAAPSRTLRLERDLRDVVVKGDVLFVTTFRQANVLTLDASTGSVIDRAQPMKTRAAFLSGLGGKIAPGSNGGSVVLTASPAVAWRMVSGPEGNPVVIHQRGLDGEVGTQPGGYGDGRSCAGVVESAITEIAVGGQVAAQLRSTKALANTVLPVDIAISPSGHQMAFVGAGQAGNKVQFLAFNDPAAMATAMGSAPSDTTTTGDGCVTPSPVPLPEPEVPTVAPDSMLPTPIEFRPANGEVIAVAFDLKGNVLVQSRNPANLQILTQRSSPIVLSQQARYDGGHALFHQATPGQIACASCHPEGGEDSRAWRFQGLGARRTQSLRGGIMETAPFHWDGQLRDMDQLMADVFQQRMGGGQVSDKQVGALTGWIDAIPRVDLKGTADLAAIERGKALFLDPEVGCAACHAGSKLTNNKIADVGTGGLLQTPQLIDLALRAPYMHNGCAKTLKDRFSGACGGDDRHGVTSKLSSPQIDDLIGYLETL